MGSSESNNLDSNDSFNFKIKNEISDNKGAIDDETMIEYLEKAKYATCKIELNNSKYGSGFFCKIPSKDDENILMNVLLTNEHVLKYDDVFSEKEIKLIVNNKEKIISLKEERKRWSNKNLDYSCIEIIKKDKIKDFYYLDDKILKNDYSNDIYLEKNILIFGIMKNKKRGHSDGLIKGIKQFCFVHNCNTYPGCSGAVIVNKNNNLVIGVHKGELETEKKLILNVGIFIKYILEDIYKNNNMIKFEKNEIKHNLDIKNAKFFEIENIKITNIGNKEFKSLFFVIDSGISSKNLLFYENSKKNNIHKLTLDGPFSKGQNLNDIVTLFIKDPKVEEYNIFIYVREKPDGPNLSSPFKITVNLIGEEFDEIKILIEKYLNIENKGLDKKKVYEMYEELEMEFNLSSFIENEEIIKVIIKNNCDIKKIYKWIEYVI